MAEMAEMAEMAKWRNGEVAEMKCEMRNVK